MKRRRALKIGGVSLLGITGITAASGSGNILPSQTKGDSTPEKQVSSTAEAPSARIITPTKSFLLQTTTSQVIHGLSNLPVDTRIQVRIRGTGSVDFRKSKTVTVEGGGGFYALFDLSELTSNSTSSFLAEIRYNEDIIGKRSGQLIPSHDKTAFTYTGEKLSLKSARDQAVRGTTKFDEGSEVLVVLQSEGGNQFMKTNIAQVDSEGAFTARFDMSSIPKGTWFTATLRRNDTRLAYALGKVVK